MRSFRKGTQDSAVQAASCGDQRAVRQSTVNLLRLVLLAFLAATTIQASAQTAVSLNAGWNLLGNGTSTAFNVVDVFGSQANVTTVWKWVPAKTGWAFYAPSMASEVLAGYASSKGYEVLTTINGGEGFWVNAKVTFTAQLPTGTLISSTSYQNLAAGWSLIATGDGRTPAEFNLALSLTPPSPGVIPANLTSLWAWNANSLKWYFYSPVLEVQSATALADYIANKGYLNFGSNPLGATTGFWVNAPGNAGGTTTTTTTTTTTAAPTTTTTTTFAATTTTTAPTTTTTSTEATTTSTATTTTTTVAGGPTPSDTMAYAKAMSVGAWTTYARSCSTLPDPRIVAYYFFCPAGGMKGVEQFYWSQNKYVNPMEYLAKGAWSLASTLTSAGYASLLLNYTTEINVGGVYDSGAGTLGAVAGRMLYEPSSDNIVYYYNSCWWYMKRLADGSNADVDDSYCGSSSTTSNQCQADYECGRCWYCDKSGSGNICRYGGEGPYGCYRGWSP